MSLIKPYNLLRILFKASTKDAQRAQGVCTYLCIQRERDVAKSQNSQNQTKTSKTKQNQAKTKQKQAKPSKTKQKSSKIKQNQAKTDKTNGPLKNW